MIIVVIFAQKSITKSRQTQLWFSYITHLSTTCTPINAKSWRKPPIGKDLISRYAADGSLKYCAQWNILKIMITCHQITCTISWLSCKQLPYSSEQRQISRMRQRDKSEMPLLDSTYKYILPRHSSSTSLFSISKPHSFQRWFCQARTHLQSTRNPPAKPSSPRLHLRFAQKKWPSTSMSLRLISHSSPFILPQFLLSLQVHTLSIFPFFSFVSFILQP